LSKESTTSNSKQQLFQEELKVVKKHSTLSFNIKPVKKGEILKTDIGPKFPKTLKEKSTDSKSTIFLELEPCKKKSKE
jgi:hypothetical protein